MSDVTFDFSGRHVVVTGATTGIGLALAHGFRTAGAHVAITGTRPAATYGDVIDGFTFHQFDLEDPASAIAVGNTVERCDVLVNNAGLMFRDPSEMTPIGFARSVDANLNGTFRLCEALRPRLADGGGAILNVASVAATFASPRVPGYSAAKSGLVALTRSLAQAWAGDGIRVNIVSPGWIETRMTAGHVADAARTASLMARTPLGRWGKPDDLVGPMMFLCSDAARYITGAHLAVDGGYTAV